jgi:hypothetical protein
MLPRWRQVALAGVHAAARPHGGRRRWARRLQDLNFNGVEVAIVRGWLERQQILVPENRRNSLINRAEIIGG